MLYTINNYHFEVKVSAFDLNVHLSGPTKTKLRGLSPHANYTDRAGAAGRRSANFCG